MNFSQANISDLNNNGSFITLSNSSFDLNVCGNLTPDYIRVREKRTRRSILGSDCTTQSD